MDAPFGNKSFDSCLEMKIHAGDFPVLWQFPKEFRRNWFKQLDVRFLMILLATFAVEVSLVLSFLSWGRGGDEILDANSIQKRYAHLLLAKSAENDFFLHDSKQSDTFLYGVPEEIATEESSFKNRENYEASGNGANVDNIKSRGSQSSESNFAGQSGSNGTSNSDKNNSAEKVGSIGILAYLSDDKVGSNENLNDIFTQGDGNSRYLEGTLANVKFTNLKQGDETGGSEAERGGVSSRGLKGSKSIVSKKEVQASLSPLEKASYRTVAKNTEIEESSLSILNKTGSKAVARKAEQVTRVVLDHNRAIQDCYKQALKKQPDLKGKVVVRFSVTPEGRVDLVEVINSTIDYEPIIDCIVSRIRRWNDFGESDISLGTVSYRQTYVFGY